MTSPFSIAAQRSAALIEISLLTEEASNSSLLFRAFSKMVSKWVTPLDNSRDGCEMLEGAKPVRWPWFWNHSGCPIACSFGGSQFAGPPKPAKNWQTNTGFTGCSKTELAQSRGAEFGITLPACQHGWHEGISSKLLHMWRPFALSLKSALYKLVGRSRVKVIFVIRDWRTCLPKTTTLTHVTIQTRFIGSTFQSVGIQSFNPWTGQPNLQNLWFV